MGRRIDTVIIEHPRDPSVPLRINATDFDPREHTPFGQSATVAKPIVVGRTDWYLLFSTKGWRALRSSAEDIGYVKPDDLSWEEAIPEIIAHETEVLDGQAE
jgi:hypothetical protein